MKILRNILKCIVMFGSFYLILKEDNIQLGGLLLLLLGESEIIELLKDLVRK